jgi:hypothetical protein
MPRYSFNQLNSHLFSLSLSSHPAQLSRVRLIYFQMQIYAYFTIRNLEHELNGTGVFLIEHSKVKSVTFRLPGLEKRIANSGKNINMIKREIG